MRPKVLLRLYPRAWRERYGEEMLSLVESERPSGLGAGLDLIRGALVAHFHPLTGDRDVARATMALRLTRWLPLFAVFLAAAIVFISFDSGRPRPDWRILLPPSLLQDLLHSPFSSIAPTLAQAEALETPRVAYFMFRAEELRDLAVHLEMLVLAFLAALMWAVLVPRRTSRNRPR